MGGSADAEPVIRRVKVLGPESRNGRLYTAEARRSAVPLYEGAKVYFDHRAKSRPGEPAPDRAVIDRFGVLENVREEGDSVYADLRFNPRHLYADTVRGWIDTDPTALGFSHDVDAERHFDADGTMVVTRIAEVHAVDLVEDPATTHGLFESCTSTESSMDPLLDTPPAPDAEKDAPADSEAQTLAQKIGELIAHIADDPDMSPEEKDAKLKAVMKILGKGEAEDPVTEEDESGDGEMERAEESVRRKGDKAALRILENYKKAKLANEVYTLREARVKAEAKARKMCVEAKLPAAAVTPTFVEVLTEAASDEKRAALIADRKIGLGTFRGAASAPQTPAKSGKLTVDEFLAGV